MSKLLDFFQVIESIGTFLNARFTNTIVTLVLGGIILGFVNHRRSRQDKVREKSIDFLEVTGELINLAISNLFGIIRREEFRKNIEFRENLDSLFHNRFKVKINSKAYLDKSSKFDENYDELILEIRHIYRTIQKKGDKRDELAIYSNGRVEELSRKWNIKYNEVDHDQYSSPVKELHIWNTILFRRAVFMLSSEISRIDI